MTAGIDKLFGVQETALRLRAERTAILANNLVNADTPNFKARDMDFQAVMKQSMTNQSQGAVSVMATQPGHLAPTNAQPLYDLQYRQPLQPSLDGNTVDTYLEQSEFARNALYYQASLGFVDDTIRSIKSALREE